MKNLFQNLSNGNQRIMIVSLSISLVLLSLSIFILTVSKSFANAYDLSRSPKIGVGIQGTYVYYFGEDHRLYRMPANQATDYEK